MVLDVLGSKNGAGGRNRTDTLLPKRDFESRASTNFATPAGETDYNLPVSGQRVYICWHNEASISAKNLFNPVQSEPFISAHTLKVTRHFRHEQIVVYQKRIVAHD